MVPPLRIFNFCSLRPTPFGVPLRGAAAAPASLTASEVFVPKELKVSKRETTHKIPRVSFVVPPLRFLYLVLPATDPPFRCAPYAVRRPLQRSPAPQT